jgi:hypothetical protein
MSIPVLVARFTSSYGRGVRKLVLVRAAWVTISVLFVLFVIDALFAIGDSARMLLDLALLAALAAVAVGTRWRWKRSTSYERMIARMVEQDRPELENTLINSLEFTDRLQKESPGRVTKELMAREIARAEAMTDPIADQVALAPPALTREQRWLLLSIAGAAIAIVLFWRPFAVVAPRFLLPMADLPPYSRTQFKVEPGTTMVNYGDNLRIDVTTSGELPKDVLLAMLEQGATPAEVSMFKASDGHFFQTVENIREPFEYHAKIARGRSKKYRVTVMKEPQVENVIVTLLFPEYTRLPEQTRELGDGRIECYAGTTVELNIHSNRPLMKGAGSASGAAVAFEPTPDRGLRGTFTVAAAGAFGVDITDVDGISVARAVSGEIVLRQDTPPEITIVYPAMDSFAVPDAHVPIEIDAFDDFGVAEVAILRNHNDSTDARKVLWADPLAGPAVSVRETLDLEALGVRPGDRIEYYATAKDNLPSDGQSAASPAFILQIVSHEVYRDFMQTQMTTEDLAAKYDAIMEALAELAEAQQKLRDRVSELKDKAAAGDALSAEERAELEELEAAQQAVAARTEETAKRLEAEAQTPAVFDIEEDYKELLKQFAERLRAAEGHMQDAASQLAEREEMSGAPSSRLSEVQRSQEEALKELQQNVEEFQESIQQANEDLMHVMDVIGDVEEFKYLYTLQKSLERQIRFYRSQDDLSLDDQIRLKQLSDQQAEVRSALELLKDNLRAHADELETLAVEQSAETQEVGK